MFQLIKVNHAWDTQYRKLQEHFRNEVKTRDDSFHKLQRELSQEHNQNHASVKDLLEQKDIVIGEQNAKIHKLKEELDKFKADSLQMMQRRLESELEVKYQRAKKLFQDQKKEKEIILQREEVSFSFYFVMLKTGAKNLAQVPSLQQSVNSISFASR